MLNYQRVPHLTAVFFLWELMKSPPDIFLGSKSRDKAPRLEMGCDGWMASTVEGFLVQTWEQHWGYDNIQPNWDV